MKYLVHVLLLLTFCSIRIFSQNFQYLHDFEGPPVDGALPTHEAPLVVGSMLYGVTSFGGDSNAGIIYRMRTDGSDYTVLHHFDVTSGIDPVGNLVLINNLLYGVTNQNGCGCAGGVIYSIDTSGSDFSIVHFFEPDSSEPSDPQSGLILVGTRLYGTGTYGGDSNLGGIFYYDLADSSFHTIYSFSGSPDGDDPIGRLVFADNMLFGTTAYGGNGLLGTVFKIEPDGGNFSILHEFDGATSDGSYPSGGVIVVNGMLYGTTVYGGYNDSGIIFRLDTNGNNYEILHEFDDSFDLTNPFDELTFVGSKLFGTATQGAISPGGIFCIDTNGNNYNAVVQINDINASIGPSGFLTFANDYLFGTQTTGGAFTLGAAFSYSVFPPFVSTSPISDLNVTTVTFNGNIDSIGFDSVTVRGFCWNTSGNPTIADNVVSESGVFGSGPFSLGATGLTKETTYHVRAFAINSMGTRYGSDITFVTAPIPIWALILMALSLFLLTVRYIFTKNVV